MANNKKKFDDVRFLSVELTDESRRFITDAINADDLSGAAYWGWLVSIHERCEKLTIGVYKDMPQVTAYIGSDDGRKVAISAYGRRLDVAVVVLYSKMCHCLKWSFFDEVDPYSEDNGIAFG